MASKAKSPPAFDLTSYATSPRKHHLKATNKDVVMDADQKKLEDYMETRREKVIEWYNDLLRKTKKYGKHYYSKKYENDGLDAPRMDHVQMASEQVDVGGKSVVTHTTNSTRSGLKAGTKQSQLSRNMILQTYEDKYVRYLYSGGTKKRRNPLLDSVTVISSEPLALPFEEKDKEPIKDRDLSRFSDVGSDWSHSSCSRSGSINHTHIAKTKMTEVSEIDLDGAVIEPKTGNHRHVHNNVSLYSMHEIEYFDKEKILAIRKYQFILYAPACYSIFGLLCFYISIGDKSSNGWELFLYTYPILQLISFLLLYCPVADEESLKKVWKFKFRQIVNYTNLNTAYSFV
ncbi:hypothetical protein RFI_17491 [Reticulomyxa filosa]|uniref:Uncharacterized protein n=1 Tax=Reticulomyxa filosa TaxID=46433 RepID=X6N1E7_RETFI|nr:hypothetical protein RFI_17491 [Reticulomyxa filosa]|eukprot:ETO19738.1 hypothetical protein RFI_17491 [Reticulomyxa filosa]